MINFLFGSCIKFNKGFMGNKIFNEGKNVPKKVEIYKNIN